MSPTCDLKGLQKKGPVKGTKGAEAEGDTKMENRCDGGKKMLNCCSANGHGIFRSWKRKKTIFLKSLKQGRTCGHLAFTHWKTAYFWTAQLKENRCALFSTTGSMKTR